MKAVFCAFFSVLLILILSPATSHADTSCEEYLYKEKVWWDGAELKSGQIGRLTVLKDTSLYKVNGDDMTFSRTLRKGEIYRIYAFKPGMLSVGGGYFVNRNMNIKYETPSKAKLKAAYCVYKFDPEKIFKERTEKIISEAGKKKTQLAQLLYVRKQLLDLISYDNDGFEQYIKSGSGINSLYNTAWGSIVFQKAYCDGYSEALNYILNRLNIHSVEVVSWDMDYGHGWNMVELDNQYYHVDITWDDPEIPSSISYNYFLLTDKQIKAKDHYGWETDLKATSNKYSFFNDRNYLTFDDNNVYYLDHNAVYATSLFDLKDRKIPLSAKVIDFDYHNGYFYTIEKIEDPNWDKVGIFQYDSNLRNKKKVKEADQPPEIYNIYTKNDSIYYYDAANEMEIKLTE